MQSFSIPYTADASACYDAIADMPWAVWLDSGGLGRYDILCAQPVVTLVTHCDATDITDASGTRRVTDDPFDLLRQQLGAPVVPMSEVPFAGGRDRLLGLRFDAASDELAKPVKEC